MGPVQVRAFSSFSMHTPSCVYRWLQQGLSLAAAAGITSKKRFLGHVTLKPVEELSRYDRDHW